MLGLLVLQSMSSFVLDSYQELLRNHLVVTLFLTMLVGAGGNAGNQSAIKVIRGLVYLCSLLLQCWLVKSAATDYPWVQRQMRHTVISVIHLLSVRPMSEESMRGGLHCCSMIMPALLVGNWKDQGDARSH